MHERSPEYNVGEGQSTLPHRPLPAPAAPEPLTQESTHTRQLDSLALATTPRRRVGELFEHVWVNYLTRDSILWIAQNVQQSVGIGDINACAFPYIVLGPRAWTVEGWE